MENRDASDVINVSEMRQHLAHEFPEWVSRTEPQLKLRPTEWLQQFYLDADVTPKVKLIATRFYRLSLWYRGCYASSGIGAMPDRALLALSTRAAISGFFFEVPLYDYHPKNLGRYSLTDFGPLLAQIIATGWKDQAELVARHGFRELNRLMDRGISYGRLGWFMLELAKNWLKADVSLYSEFRAHKIENLGVWDKLLAGWRDKDSTRFDALMREMAEYHLSQSRATEAGEEEQYYEFESITYRLFPIELLAVLRLREWEGIPNPPLSHPLFSVTPLADLYPPPAWPLDEVLDKAEAKFRALYPNTPSVADLPALRKEQGEAR